MGNIHYKLEDNIKINVKYNNIKDKDKVLIKDINWNEIIYIECRYCSLSDLEWIKYAPKLMDLYCNNNKIKSLDGLQNCIQLEYIYCLHTKLTSLNGLQNCTQLKEIYCCGTELTSFDGLQKCTQLQIIEYSYNKLTSLYGLENCISLKKLTISGAKLTSLNKPYNSITSLDGLQNCVQLQVIACDSNYLTSLHGLENCTLLEELNISYNSITTLPNFLIGFRNLENILYDGLGLELDARQLRWLNRIQNRQCNTNSIQVYGNSQNVHDSSIQDTVRSSMSRLLNQPMLSTYNIDTLTNNIVLDTVLTPKSKDQLLSYISTSTSTSTSIQEELVELSLTYGELLWAVWQTIHKLGEFDEETQIQIKQILNQELEDSDCKCFTGRMTRLVNCLNGFSPLVEVKIFDGVQIGNIVAIIKQRLVENERDGYKEGYTVEKHREEFSKEMLNRGESMELINEWIAYIE